MKRRTKVWLIIAGLLVLIGGAVFVAMLGMNHWDLSTIENAGHEEKTLNIQEGFQSLSIETGTENLAVVPSKDGQCRISYETRENWQLFASVENGTLTVRTEDNRSWFDISRLFGTGSFKITVELPERAYEQVSISGTTGEVELANLQLEELNCALSTGRIDLKSVEATGDVQLSVTTGKIEVTDVSCRDFNSAGGTGDLTMTNLLADGKISISRSTGDITFKACDAEELTVKTTTGDVTGTLRREKEFIASSHTGQVEVPRTGSGGKCEVSTTTGKIILEVAGE